MLMLFYLLQECYLNLGNLYKGIWWMVYLFVNEKGIIVLYMLGRVFKQGLIFIIGFFRIMGCNNVVMWNDIYYKIRRSGGLERYCKYKIKFIKMICFVFVYFYLIFLVGLVILILIILSVFERSQKLRGLWLWKRKNLEKIKSRGEKLIYI